MTYEEADQLQNEAIGLWQQGNLSGAYHLLCQIPAEAWDHHAANMTHTDLMLLLKEQMDKKFIGTQAEVLYRMMKAGAGDEPSQ